MGYPSSYRDRTKGKSYAEYTAEKQGTSYKAKLKTAIDTLIPQVKDFDELLRRLQEMGYEIKQGKYISFRAAGQERFTRTKTLGAAYTEEAIKERIKGVYVAKTKTLREDKKSGLSSILKTVSKPNSRRAMNGGQKSII